jgi:hypothetical protein
LADVRTANPKEQKKPGDQPYKDEGRKYVK